MKSVLYLNIILILFFFDCTSNNTIERKIVPIETYETKINDENCVSIISKNFEISFQELKDEQLENFFENIIIFNKLKLNHFRIPTLFFCKIILDNSGPIPLEIGDIKIRYENTTLNTLKADIINKYNKHLHEINFNDITNLYKVTSDDLCENDSDSGKDLIKYNSSLIQPGDKVMQILIFNRIPVNIRKFTLSITIKSDITQKIIDFKLMKFEYRKSGKHFIKLKKDDFD